MSLWTFGLLTVMMAMLLSIGLLHRETSNRIIKSLTTSFSGALSGAADGTEDASKRNDEGVDAVGPDAIGGRDSVDPAALEQSGGKKKVRRWTKFQIISQSERAGRVVAGRKESISFDLRIQPVYGMLPDREQLADLSSDLHSDLHNTTFVYFYLPGMDARLGAWATAHHKPGGSFAVRFFESNIPPEFR